MSNTFVFNRFFALIGRQWISFGKIYLMAIGIAAGIIAAFYGYAIKEYYQALAYGVDVQELLSFRPFLFIFLGLLFVTIISGTYFSDLGQKPKAIFEILVPASRLEKFFSALFYTALVCIVSYILVFTLIDLAFVSHLRSVSSSGTSWTAEGAGVKTVRDNLAYFHQYDIPKEFRYFYFLPLLLNAIFLLGSIAFRNFQYIKTAISLIAYIAVWTIALVYLMKFLTQGTASVGNGGWENNQSQVLSVVLTIGIVLSLLFYIIGFLRLKEKEV